MSRLCQHNHVSKYPLANERGASIVIALVFFLICAVVGSLVLTAASINAKAVATHRETQQSEYTVTSAAQAIVKQLVPTTIEWSGDKNNPVIKSIATPVSQDESLMYRIWSSKIKEIWAVRNNQSSTPYAFAEPFVITVTGHADMTVYAWVSIDRDFNMKVDLSTETSLTASAAYKETVTAQCIPTFDNTGWLTKCEWKDAVIKKELSS